MTPCLQRGSVSSARSRVMFTLPSRPQEVKAAKAKQRGGGNVTPHALPQVGERNLPMDHASLEIVLDCRTVILIEHQRHQDVQAFVMADDGLAWLNFATERSNLHGIAEALHKAGFAMICCQAHPNGVSKRSVWARNTVFWGMSFPPH